MNTISLKLSHFGDRLPPFFGVRDKYLVGFQRFANMLADGEIRKKSVTWAKKQKAVKQGRRGHVFFLLRRKKPNCLR